MFIKPVVKAELEQFLYFIGKALSQNSSNVYLLWVSARDAFSDLKSTLNSVDCENQINGIVNRNSV